MFVILLNGMNCGMATMLSIFNTDKNNNSPSTTKEIATAIHFKTHKEASDYIRNERKLKKYNEFTLTVGAVIILPL